MNQLPANSIMIAEDEPLVAIDLEYMLGQCGYKNVAVFTTGEHACDWLTSNSPPLAIIDIHLKDGPCTDLVGALRERDVPFIVCSAVMKDGADKLFQTAVWVSKPCRQQDLVQAVRKVLRHENDTHAGIRPKLSARLESTEENVNFICRQVERVGSCRVAFAGDERLFVIEKVRG